MSNDRFDGRGILLPLPAYWKPTAEGEWDIVQGLLSSVAHPLTQEFLVHYYISAKTWPMVLLTGRPEVDRSPLFHLLASSVAGCSDGQILLLPAQSRWDGSGGKQSVRPAGEPTSATLGTLQGRFNTWAFLDMLSDATMPGNEGMAYFLGIDQAMTDELGEYMDLYLVRHGEEEPHPLPANVYLTAIVSVPGGAWCLPSFLLDRVGIVEVSGLVPEMADPSQPRCPPVGRQRSFVRSTLRDPERARRRLQSIEMLSEFYRLLGALPAVLRAAIGPVRQEGLLLYTANSFTAEGTGLLDGEPLTNLRHAIDLQLAQRLLPCVASDAPWSMEQKEEILEQMGRSYPRAHARARRLWLEQNAVEDAAGGPVALSASPTERISR